MDENRDFDMNFPFISIVIPVKNVEKNLSNLRNILNQIKNQSVEIIFVQDVFDEPPSLNLQTLINSQSSRNIKLISVAAGNPGAARNSGMRLVRGRWVTFWDADDQPNLDNLISIVMEAEEKNCDVCIGSFQILKDGVLSSHVLNPKKGLNQIASNPGIWRFSFRSNLVSDVRFPSIKMGEDQIFLLWMRLSEKEIYLSKNLVYIYFRGSTSQETNLHSSRKEILRSLKISLHVYSEQPNWKDTFAREVIVRQLLTTLKIYGTSFIDWRSLRKIYLRFGLFKLVLLALSFFKVAMSLLRIRAMSKLPWP
jgi:glycosyltransferase involved in cell wall biosynthesis